MEAYYQYILALNSEYALQSIAKKLKHLFSMVGVFISNLR